MTYNFKCNNCDKKLEVEIKLKDFGVEREKLICCGVKMERDYQPTAIVTESSPSRF